MISSKNSSVTPEYDLAYLALVSSKDEAEQEKRKSVDAPALPITLDDGDSNMDVDNTENPQVMEDDGASEITLVEKAEAKQNDDDFVMIDAENKRDTRGFEDKENLPPKPEPAISSVVRPALQDIHVNGAQQIHSPKIHPPMVTPPTPPPETHEHPPPIPPRPNAKTIAKDTSLMFGRQQDVAECIENVMFQIEAAVKPEGHDENGEQVDLVKK